MRISDWSSDVCSSDLVRHDNSLRRGTITPERYASGKHVEILRRGNEIDQVEAALRSLNLKRHVVASVTGFSGALVLAAGSDLIATVPERNAWHLREDLCTFPLPFDLRSEEHTSELQSLMRLSYAV